MCRRRFSLASRPASFLLGFCLSIAAFPLPAAAQENALPGTAGSVLAASVTEAASRFGLSEGLIRAVMRAESGGNPRAISPAGAIGLMQIMPATWASLTAQHRLGADPFDIRANILAGAAYLRAMLDRYGDPSVALAAYNAGPRRVDDWRAGAQSLPAETLAYVARIAPAVGITDIAAPGRVADRSRDWPHLTLFVSRFDGASGSAIAASKTPAPRVAATPPSAASALVAARPNPLFIPLSGQTAR